MTNGIHHITAIASSAQENYNFYTSVLGLRLVKKTVNQDDTGTYHLFFGDKEGHPGMDLTFFIFLPSMKGMRGNGLVTTISLAVPENSLSFWKDRFEQLHIKHSMISKFRKERIIFWDNDNQQLELVGVPDVEMDNEGVWTTHDIKEQSAIRHFYSASLSVVSRASIDPILTAVFGYELIQQETQSYLYSIPGKRAAFLEVHESPSDEDGFNAAGTVHHIAFRAKDEQEQQEMRSRVVSLGLYPTEVINRFYFKSIYFRTPAGILFEIATDGPGFTADESLDELGVKLALPPFLESQRSQIEKNLIPIQISNE